MKKMGNKSKKTKAKNVYHFSWLATIILIVGLATGVGLIIFGIYNNNTSDYSQIEIRDEETIKNEITDTYSKLDETRNERNSLESGDEKYQELSTKIVELSAKRADLEAELLKVQNGFFDDMKGYAVSNSVPFIVAGIVSIVAGNLGCGLVLDRNKGKILASTDKTKEETK